MLRRRTRGGAGPALGTVIRAGAAACVAGAFVLPLFRKRLRVPPRVALGALAAGSIGAGVLLPPSRKRNAGVFMMQMWGFFMAHEFPYDDPEALRERLRFRYPVVTDRLIGLGRLPNTRLQESLVHLGPRNGVDRALSWTHWIWFFEPCVALGVILWRRPEQFPKAARQMAATFDIGCAIYFAVPTAPPWWSSQEGHTEGDKVRRIMVEVGEATWGVGWNRMYSTLGGNPWAAMPSLHFGTSLMAAILLAESGPVEGVIGWAYSMTLGFALVYLGEHYVTDLLAGTALVGAVRVGEPVVAPALLEGDRVLKQVGRIART